MSFPHPISASTRSMIVDLIEPGRIKQSHLINNFRTKAADALVRLEKSLESVGQIQPIICRVIGYRQINKTDEIIECISGLRRLKIAKKKNLPRIKAIVYDLGELSDADAIEIFIEDNYLTQEEISKAISQLHNILLNSEPELLRIKRLAQTHEIDLDLINLKPPATIR